MNNQKSSNRCYLHQFFPISKNSDVQLQLISVYYEQNPFRSWNWVFKVKRPEITRLETIFHVNTTRKLQVIEL